MAQVFGPPYTEPFPPTVKILKRGKRKGKPVARILWPDGKREVVRTNKKGDRRLLYSRTWHIRYYTPDGVRHCVKGYRDKKATEAKAAELERRGIRLAANLADPMEEHANKPLAEHLADFRQYLLDKGNTPAYVELTCSRISACLDSCRFIKIVDVHPSAVLGFLADLRCNGQTPELPPGQAAFSLAETARLLGIKPFSVNAQIRRRHITTHEEKGIRWIDRADVEVMLAARGEGCGVATANYYLTALKGFTHWLWRDRRSGVDPLAGMAKIGNGACRRSARAAHVGTGKARGLLHAARESDHSFHHLPGEARSMIYWLAMGTGFRAKELAQLQPESFDLDATPPTATVEGAYTKNGKTAEQPLPADLAEALAGYLADKPTGQPLWPGKWYRRGI